MADETKEIIHQHYANATAAIAAMNDQNWAYEEAANRIIVMDGATPVYFETAARLIAGGSFIVNQTASPQSGGFRVSGNGLIGGTFTLTGIQTNSAEIAAGASLAMRRTIDTGYLAVSGGNAINSGANLVMNGGSHASGANDWSFRAGATDKLVWDDSASLLTLSGGISATTGSFSSTLNVTGGISTASHISFDGYGTSGTSRIYRTASDGLIMRGNTGSTNDLMLEAADGTDILRNPTGTTQVTFPASGGVTVTNSLTSGALSATTGTFSGVGVFGIGAVTYTSKNLTLIGSSFDGTALQFENTDVNTSANGRLFNFGITDLTSTNGRFDLTQPGERTVFSVFSNGNLGLGSTTDGGEKLQVTGTMRVTGATTLAALSATTGTFSSTITGASLEVTGNIGIGYTPLYDLTVAKNQGEVKIHLQNLNTSNTSNTTLYLGTGGVGAGDCKMVFSDGTTSYVMGLDDSASDALVLSRGNTLGSNNVLTINTTGTATWAGNVVTSGNNYTYGTTTFDGPVLMTDTVTVGAGGTNWTNETDIDVTGRNASEITPTADSQTYKFTNPTSGQILTVINANASYDIYIDLTDGSGTATQYINAGRMCLFRYNGTRWYSTY